MEHLKALRYRALARKRQRLRHRKDPRHYLWLQASRRARDLGLPFEITEEDIVIPDRCPVFGFKIRIFHSTRDRCISLDRVRPDLGYVRGNIAVISFKANRIKSDATPEEIRALADWIETCI
jgi:hypothetical protein